MKKLIYLLIKLTFSLALLLCLVISYNKPVYARMGSSGGDSASFNDGSDFSGSSGSDFDDGTVLNSNSTFQHPINGTYYNSNNNGIGTVPFLSNGVFNLQHFNIDFVFSFVIALMFELLCTQYSTMSKSKRLGFSFIIFSFGILSLEFAICILVFISVSTFDKLSMQRRSISMRNFYNAICMPNMTKREFTAVLNHFNITLFDGIPKNSIALTTLYRNAEDCYAQALRDAISNVNSVNDLEQYLMPQLYQTMQAEIESKRENNIADNIIISKCLIVQYAEFNDFIITEIACTGLDDERNVSNFTSNHRQQKWHDYVIYQPFGKGYKIANIVYGGRLHSIRFKY